jgi:hypothetical protein
MVFNGGGSRKRKDGYRSKLDGAGSIKAGKTEIIGGTVSTAS